MSAEGVIDRTPGRRAAQAGPPLLLVAAVSAGLFAAGVAVPLVLSGGLAYPSPADGGDAVRIAEYLTEAPAALQWAAVFHFASAVPLAIFAAAAAARLHALGVRAAGPTIALVGGVLAAVALATSACVQWVLSRTDPSAPPALLVALRDVVFVTGGPWHVVGLGLLLAGIAVPAAVTGLLTRPVWTAGIGIAAVCELATLALVVPAATYLVPIGRFGGLAWLLLAAVRLPIRRPSRRRAGDRDAR